MVIISIILVGIISISVIQSRKIDVAAYKKQFVFDCMASGGSSETCACAYTVLEDNYQSTEFARVERDSRKNQELLNKAADKCVTAGSGAANN